MTKNLVIVESPTKSKTIEKFLGRNYTVRASMGHLRDLPKSLFGVDIEHDFEPKYINIRGKGELIKELKTLAKKADKIYLATDPDREGEAIGWHLAHILGVDPEANCRIEFHEITSGAIKDALKNPRPIDLDKVDAQQARRIIDRIVGYQLSPLLWRKIRKGLSAGRVQSVAVKIIADREKEIADFIPKEYWTLNAKLREKAKAPIFEAEVIKHLGKKLEIHTAEEAAIVEKALAKAAYIIEEATKKERKRNPLPPFTTSSLQQEASRKLGFTTKLTMLIAQQLYEGVEIQGQGVTGLITYIRTDSVRVAEEAQAQARDYIAETYGQPYVPAKPNVYKGRKGAQDAHEAIRPASLLNRPQDVKASLNNNQYKLYKLIFERFLASQMTEARYEVSTVTLDANGCTYRTTGSRTLFDGYTVLYTEGKDEAEEAEPTLPKLTVGEELQAASIDKEQKFTQAPPRYTEASLVKLLEEKGIGRPSTYAPTISTIIERGYVQREKKQLVPTELGFVVTQLMKDNFKDIVDVKFTADMESKLDKVKDGEQEWTAVINDFYGPFEKTVEKASQSIEKIVIQDEVSDVPCDKCGAMMVYKMGRFGRFLACPNFPACRNTKAIVEKIDVPCPKCGAALIKRKSKRGKVFYGCERYPECDFVSWDRPTKEKCPKCGGMMVHKMGQNGGYTLCTDKACGYVVRPQKKDKEEKENDG